MAVLKIWVSPQGLPFFLPETQFLQAFGERFLHVNLLVLLLQGIEGLQIPSKV